MASRRGPGQLPPGRHGLPRDYVADNQRKRIVEAVVRATAELGYADLKVDAIVAGAGVSRRTFYQHFGNKDEAFLAAYEMITSQVVAAVERVDATDLDLAELTEQILRAVLTEIAANPAGARVFVVEGRHAGKEVLERRDEMLRRVVDYIDAKTAGFVSVPPAPAMAAETVVGGVAEVIYNRVQRDETDRLPELLPDLVYCVLLPFVGSDAAAAEHRRLSAG